MHKFDSAKIDLALSVEMVETLINDQFRTFTPTDRALITDLTLALADHSRVCALLAYGWENVLAPYAATFAQVTDIEPEDAGGFLPWGAVELERRFGVCIDAMKYVGR